MKTISKRFLKASVAMLLVVMMLFSSTISGFAAVVDNADTSADADITLLGANSTASDGNYRLYFKFSGGSNWWNGSGCYHYAWVWGTNMTDQWCPIYKVGTTSTASTGSTSDVFYMNIPSGTLTGMKLIRAKSTSPGWSNYYNATGDITIPNNISTYNLITAVTQDSTSVTQSSRYLTVSVATKGATVTNALGGSGTSSDPYIVTSGQVMNVSATSTIDDHNFKVGYGYNSSTQYTTTATGTVTASTTSGTHSFNVYYTPLLNGSTSYKGTQSSTTVYYKVEDPTYTATFEDHDGTVLSTQTGLKNGETPTAPSNPSRDGYNFIGWEPAITAINGADQTYVAQYELAGVCSPVFADTSKMELALGASQTRTATLNEYCSGGTVSYSSSATGVATVDANGEVTALSVGKTTITATCSTHGSTDTYEVEVLAPEFEVADVTVDVNGTATATPTITANEPVGAYTIKYFSHTASNSDYYAINESTGVVSGQKPTTPSAIASASVIYNGKSVASYTFNVKVNEPEVSLNKTTLKLLTGQTANLSVTSTPDYESVAWTPASVATVGTDGTVSTTATTGTDNVTATVKYNEFYSIDLTCAVTVASPTLTVTPATLNLEIGEGSTSTTGTVTVTNNDTAGADGTDAVAPVLAVTSSKPEVATASVVDGKINVEAKALGTTTLTVSYRGVEKQVTVNVATYDPYVYLYVTNNQNFDKLCIYSWVEGGSNITPLGTNMIYIGKNGDGHKVFAYRFLKTNKPNRFIITKDNTWNWQTADISVSWSSTNHKAFYFSSADSGTGMGDWTSSCMIVRPTVSVEDLTVVMGETGTATATVTNGDKVAWTIAETTVATVANVATQTATVTSVAPGNTTISARAFVDTANSSIKTLPTNYATDTACWPFISTEATATVTVDPGSDRTITVAPSYTTDGTTYDAGTVGGTATVTYDGASDVTANVPYNGEFTLTAQVNDGYRFVGFYNGDTVVSTEATYTTTAKDNADYVAKFIKSSTVTVNGVDEGPYDVGVEVTVTAVIPEGQYISNATASPAVELNVNQKTGEIKFTMPAQDVTIATNFADLSYINFEDTEGITIDGLNTGGYMAGEEVEIKVEPKSDMVTITGIEVSDDALTVTPANGSYTITGTLAAGQTVTVTPAIEAKFQMDYDMVAIGNYGTGVTSGFGTVSMKIGDTALAKGGYADKTETVTYTAAESNANYTFAGFYSDADCKDLLTYETTYSCNPTEDTTVYTLWARRQYMDFDSGTTNIVKELTYDKEERIYTLDTVLADNSSTTAISKGAWFQVTNDKNSWTAQPSYHHYGSDFTVTHNAKGFDATITWNDGGDSWKLTTSAANDTAIKFILTPTGNTAIDFSAQVGEVGDLVYLSSGRLDLPGSYNATVFEATSTFTHEGATNPADVYVANEGENREKYKRIALTEAQTVSFETEITGTAASNYYVYRYVVYHINTESYSIVTPASLGNNKYSGSVFLDGDAYIIPIYFLTPEYVEANNLAEIDIYFDATAIKDQAWGPFVACYAWGSNNTEYHGGWSGQMMIPSEDGLSFYTMLTVPKSDDTTATSIPNGVTFNNYTQSTVPGSNPGAFGISATQYQCYDYREPITLYEAGYEVITFVAKDSTDGYHGDRANGVTANTVTTTTTDIFNKYDFDYLYSRDGETPMDLNGDEITVPVDISVNKDDYYIINKGDITYDPNGTKYVGDNAFDADWAVDWYVFDSTGKFITNIMSTAMWHDKDNDLEDLYTYLHEALGVTAADVAGKTVAISYEHENNAGHQVSYDGQWYGNYLDDDVIGDVLVGLVDGNGVYTIDDDNVADYGEGYLVDENGDTHQTLAISMDLGEASLSAVRKDGYRFIGWHTKQPDGSYKLISSAFDYTTLININTTYYAIFKEIQSGEVVINHSVYKNTDPAIPDHGGVSEMYIEVVNPNGTVVSSTPSTSRSTITFAGTDTQTYTIRIITTPLMNGEFFAWYTDSTKADGTKTYEEVFTSDAVVGSTKQVVAEFEYTYDQDNSQKVINIYSDVRRVSNYATLKYQYRNRFGQIRTYIVPNVLLTDEECEGFVGNEYNKYCPTFRTELTFVNKNDDTDVKTVYCPQEEVESRITAEDAKGYTHTDSFNKIVYYAPSDEVTEVYGQDVIWNVADVNLTPATSEITLKAEQTDCTYYLSYQIGTTTDTIPGKFNDLVEIEAPGTLDGQKFSYWVEIKDGEEVILTYLQNYRYRLTENKSIKAIYKGAITDLVWTPSINSVTYTREFGDGGDYIYTDYLLAYNNNKALELNQVKKDENGNAQYKYGLLLVRDADYYYQPTTEIAIVFPDAKDAQMKQGLETIASGGKSDTFDVSGNTYNCYCYDLTEYDLTNLNRCNYFRKYDNNKVVGGSHYYREYAFTAVAYLIDAEGNIYLSEPEEVNFYDLATKDTDTIN